jgi:hypothetical protein
MVALPLGVLNGLQCYEIMAARVCPQEAKHNSNLSIRHAGG